MTDSGKPGTKANRRPGCGLSIILLLMGLQVALYTAGHARLGMVSVVCWYFGSDPLIWTALPFLLVIIGTMIALFRRPFWNRRRGACFAGLLILALLPNFYGAFPSTHDDSPSNVAFRLPLDGPVTVGWGGPTADVNYHVKAPDQRWAYDLLVTRDGKSHGGEGASVEDYYCYGMPVLAPADGTVRRVESGAPDMPVGQLGGFPPGGNYVVLQVAPDEFLFLCHLQPESIRVKQGDTVRQGDTIGLVGNSGNTSEPHLHIHLQDSPDFAFGEGIPLRFHGYKTGGEYVEDGIPTGGYDGNSFSGEIVEHVNSVPDQPAMPRGPGI